MTAATRARRPLVGRHVELSRLIALVNRADAGSGGCAVGSGLSALITGRVVSRFGLATGAASCAACLTASLVLLGIGSSSLVAVLTSALIFGVGYMAGSAVLAIWTSQLAPGRATASFTVALIVGAVTSIAVPVAVGALVGMLGLSALLLTTAATTLVVAAILLLPWARRYQSCPQQVHGAAARPLDEA